MFSKAVHIATFLAVTGLLRTGTQKGNMDGLETLRKLTLKHQ